MTVKEAEEKRIELQKLITYHLEAFQVVTGLRVYGVDFHRGSTIGGHQEALFVYVDVRLG